MKIFLSWSGKVSHDVALTLREWLPSVIQAIEPFVSSEDIERGARWFTDIGSELENVNFGILCITPENITAPWVLFEAGALSKTMDQSRVTPFLIGVKNSDLEGPLAQFNTTSLEKGDILKLIKTINKQLGTATLAETTLEKAFEKWWPDLEKQLQIANENTGKCIVHKSVPSRPQEEILEEILELARSISRQVTKSAGIEKFGELAKTYLLLSRLNSDKDSQLNWLAWNDLIKLKGKDTNLDEIWSLPSLIEKLDKKQKESEENSDQEKGKE